MQHEHLGMTMDMPSAPVAQFASGTSWIPASSPQFMWMKPLGNWTLMAHGESFLGYNQQGGRLGVAKLESENWLMLMEERKLGAATLQVRQMLSAPGQSMRSHRTTNVAPLSGLHLKQTEAVDTYRGSK